MKILVRGTNWVGDAVMTIPALRELRRIFPDSEISLHTRSWARGIFQDAEFIDEIITFEPAKSKIKTVFAQSKVLKEKRFDLAVLFPNSMESALIAKIARIPKIFGYAKEGRSFLLSDAIEIPVWKNERHEVFYYLNLVAEIEKGYFGTQSVLENEPRPDLKVSAERRAAARAILAENGVDLSKKTVALGVGSTNSRAKRWHTGSYAKLNDRLQSELNANVVLVGAKDESDVSAEVFEKAERKPLILTGKTNLSEAVAVLSEVDLLVSNDMGLAHIAPAAGTQTIVIFGPTNEKTTRPFSLNAEIVRRNVECSPCMLRDCPIDHRCMTRISVEEIFENAKEKLSADKQEMNQDNLKPQKTVFIDRDGTLIEEVNFLHKVEELRFFPFTDEAVSILKENGFLIVVVTNQSGIGRKIFNEAAMHEIHAKIQEELTERLDEFYFCPHLPDAGCKCRKPNLGMIETACANFNIDLENSWIVGDKAIDVETGFNAGIKTALVLTGYGKKSLQTLERKPDVIAENLLEAVKFITEK